MQHFCLSAVQEDNSVIILAFGDIDFLVCEKLAEAVRDAIVFKPSACILDFANVTFIDGATVKALLQIRYNLKKLDINFELINCSPHVIKVISVLGLQSVLLSS